MNAPGRNSLGSSHSSDQFNLYGAARERTHYQRANAFISNAFNFLGGDNYDAYKYYDQDNGESPIINQPYNQNNQYQQNAQQQYPWGPQSHAQQPYSKRFSESEPTTLKKPGDGICGCCGKVTCCLIAVIVILLLAVAGVVAGLLFGFIFKAKDYNFTSTIGSNEPWNPDLSDPNSEAYKNFTATMNDALNKAFDTASLSKYSKPQQNIQEFRQTSSGGSRKKRAAGDTECDVITSFKATSTPNVDQFKKDANVAFAALKSANKIDLELSVLNTYDSSTTIITTTTTQATSLVSRTDPSRTTPAPVTCTAAASAGVNSACTAFTGDVSFPNWLGHTTAAEAESTFQTLKTIADTNCLPEGLRFACTLLFNPCANSKTTLPCRKFCTDFAEKCKYPLSCDLLPDSDDAGICVTSAAQLAIVEAVPSFTFACPTGEERCGIEPNCVATTSKCNGSAECPDGHDELNCQSLVTFSCDFDTSTLCSFVFNDAANHFQWQRKTGPTGSPYTGPFIDHTMRTSAGGYMYAEASGRYFLDSSVAWTPSRNIESESCLQFYYHMRGNDVNKLEVQLERNSVVTTPWFQTGNRGNYWLLGRVKLVAGQVKIGFRATVSGGSAGDIAIDDITIKKEPCKNWNCETDEKRVKLFNCGNTNCILESSKCNGVDDCGNYDDERNCVCTKDQFRCGIGMCIPSRKRCDGFIDCPDQADELGCRCPLGQILCADNTTCIMREWQCDRQTDCPGGDDERNCRTCSASQWQCRDYGCVGRNHRCDGSPQCPDKSDEEQCVQLTSAGVVMVTTQAESYPVCYTSDDSALGTQLCKDAGFGPFVSSSASIQSSQQQFVHVSAGTGTVLSRSLVNTSCTDNQVLQVSCTNQVCGKALKNAAASTYVINGVDAAGGRWPWQVALFKSGSYNCGGVIINSRQIVTAAHCITENTLARVYSIMAGSSILQGEDGNRVYRQVKEFVIHDSFSYLFWYNGGDIAVLTLEGYLPINNYIQPICLPESTDVFYSSSTCYSSGFGLTDAQGTTASNILQEAKTQIVSREKCLIGYTNLAENTVCAGYDSGFIANCRGDSGGPLMCLGSDNLWNLVGVYAIHPEGCNVPNRPAVFTDVLSYREWLQNQTICEHMCTNGRCIFTKDLCDGSDDCGDNSDEEVICDNPMYHDTSCTFENSYLCGYSSYNMSTYEQVEWKQGAAENNKGPSADNTRGNSAGHYMYAATGPALLMGPAYAGTAARCLTFYYMMRGTSSTLQIVRHPLASGTTIADLTIDDTQKTVVQTIDSTAATSIWQFAKVDLATAATGVTSEVLGFEFTGTAPNIAIDDIKLLGSACSTHVCEPNTFQCTDKSDCIPTTTTCNFATQCADKSEETEANCPINTESEKSYLCDFEDLNLCGINQLTDELSDWKLLPSALSQTTTGIRWLGTPGHYIYTDTRTTSTSDTISAVMSIDLEIRNIATNTQLCLEFQYYAVTSGFLQVVSVDENGAENITKLFDSHKQGWTTRRIHLDYGVKKLIFRAFSTPAVLTDSFDYIAIDDISIKHGQCACAADQQPCADGIHCYLKSNLCQGQNECPDGSDNPLTCNDGCDASMNQFNCSNGRCISMADRCNTVDNCGDDSDERNCMYCNDTNTDNFLCSDGYCLKKSFKCDGVKDCSDDEDSCCPAGQFQCSTSTLSCIASSLVCDGSDNCGDKSDELRCARLGQIGDKKNILQIRKGNQWHPVCAAGHSNTLDASICDHFNLGSSTAEHTSVTLPAGQTYYRQSTGTTFQPHLFENVACPSNEAVAIICSQSGPPCGFRDPEALSPVAFIVGGSLVTDGTWPWVGFLTHDGEYTCAGSLIADQWFLTAAHCLTHTSAGLYGVVLGTTKQDSSTSSTIRSEVEKVVRHTGYVTDQNGAFFTQNDIALLKLKTKVSAFSLSVNRICLPAATDTYSSTDHCFVAGWGASEPGNNARTSVQDLRQLRLQIVADGSCKNPTGADIHNPQNQLCAGYSEAVSGVSPSSCNGDSGGALMCRRSGIWTAVGVVSWGLELCKINQPTVFTKVSSYKAWIDAAITAG